MNSNLFCKLANWPAWTTDSAGDPFYKDFKMIYVSLPVPPDDMPSEYCSNDVGGDLGHGGDGGGLGPGGGGGVGLRHHAPATRCASLAVSSASLPACRYFRSYPSTTIVVVVVEAAAAVAVAVADEQHVNN